MVVLLPGVSFLFGFDFWGLALKECCFFLFRSNKTASMGQKLASRNCVSPSTKVLKLRPAAKRGSGAASSFLSFRRPFSEQPIPPRKGFLVPFLS